MQTKQTLLEGTAAIKYCDKEMGDNLTFISNMTDELELNGLEIANIYRHRWDVESFFYDKHIIMQSWRQSYVDSQRITHFTSRFNFT